MRRLCLALFLTMACGLAPGGVRAADDTPVASLADGRSGKIFFESVTPTGYFQLVRREATTEAVIFATLLLPPASAGKVPAMVVSHGSGGVSEGREHWWARELVKRASRPPWWIASPRGHHALDRRLFSELFHARRNGGRGRRGPSAGAGGREGAPEARLRSVAGLIARPHGHPATAGG